MGRVNCVRPVVAEIVQFFGTGKAPVDVAETLGIYTVMTRAWCGAMHDPG
jgi:hypothetical protein